MAKQNFGGLSEDEFEILVERAAKRAAELATEPAAKRSIELIQQDVGKNVIRAAYWAVSAVLLGLIGWLGSKGLIK